MQLAIVDVDELYNAISKNKKQLEKLNKTINWEMFRPTLTKAVCKDMSRGGRPRFDVVLMFKIMILQQLYNLSDEGVEDEIRDKLSFMHFLQIPLGGRVPDANTLWDFKQELIENDVDKELFNTFNTMLKAAGIITHAGSIVDATFVDTPKRHTTTEDNERLKDNLSPVDLSKKCEERLEAGEIKDSKNVMSQMDLDARYAKKNSGHILGIKNTRKWMKIAKS